MDSMSMDGRQSMCCLAMSHRRQKPVNCGYPSQEIMRLFQSSYKGKNFETRSTAIKRQIMLKPTNRRFQNRKPQVVVPPEPASGTNLKMFEGTKINQMPSSALCCERAVTKDFGMAPEILKGRKVHPKSPCSTRDSRFHRIRCRESTKKE